MEPDAGMDPDTAWNKDAALDPLTDELIRLGKEDAFLSVKADGEYDEGYWHRLACETGETLGALGGGRRLLTVRERVVLALGECEAGWGRIGGLCYE